MWFPRLCGHDREVRRLISTVPVGIALLPVAAWAVGRSVARNALTERYDGLGTAETGASSLDAGAGAEHNASGWGSAGAGQKAVLDGKTPRKVVLSYSIVRRKIMPSDNITSLAAAYLRYFRSVKNGEERDGPLFDAVMEMEELRRRDVEKTWHLVLELLAQSGDDADARGYVAAGPLEDFVVDHANHRIQEIEDEARVNENLRCALKQIWIDEEDCDPRVWQRVRQLIET